jgi:hypothetical protein
MATNHLIRVIKAKCSDILPNRLMKCDTKIFTLNSLHELIRGQVSGKLCVLCKHNDVIEARTGNK